MFEPNSYLIVLITMLGRIANVVGTMKMYKVRFAFLLSSRHSQMFTLRVAEELNTALLNVTEAVIRILLGPWEVLFGEEAKKVQTSYRACTKWRYGGRDYGVIRGLLPIFLIFAHNTSLLVY